MIGLAIVLMLNGDAFAQVTDVETALRDLVATYHRAREQQDTLLLHQILTADADQLVSTGQWRRGRPDLVKGMYGSTAGRSSRTMLEVEAVRLLQTGVALADARYVIEGENGAPDRHMWSTFIAILEGDTWRIAGIRNMLPNK